MVESGRRDPTHQTLESRRRQETTRLQWSRRLDDKEHDEGERSQGVVHMALNNDGEWVYKIVPELVDPLKRSFGLK